SPRPSRRSCAARRWSTTSPAPRRATPSSAATRSPRATTSSCGTRRPRATRRSTPTPSASTSPEPSPTTTRSAATAAHSALAPAPGANRVAEGLQSAVGVDSKAPAELEIALELVAPRLPALGEAHVLHQHELGRREAVVDLGERDLRARVVDAGLLVGVARRAH